MQSLVRFASGKGTRGISIILIREFDKLLQMWPSLIAKAKQGGIDVIQTYVFWNQHEPQQGQYDFGGNKDIVRFMKEVQAQGLYACLRIGPYIESEWTYGYKEGKKKKKQATLLL